MVHKPRKGGRRKQYVDKQGNDPVRPPGGYQKLSRKSPAAQYLEQLFDTHELDATSTPRSTYSKYYDGPNPEDGLRNFNHKYFTGFFNSLKADCLLKQQSPRSAAASDNDDESSFEEMSPARSKGTDPSPADRGDRISFDALQTWVELTANAPHKQIHMSVDAIEYNGGYWHRYVLPSDIEERHFEDVLGFRDQDNHNQWVISLPNPSSSATHAATLFGMQATNYYFDPGLKSRQVQMDASSGVVKAWMDHFSGLTRQRPGMVDKVPKQFHVTEFPEAIKANASTVETPHGAFPGMFFQKYGPAATYMYFYHQTVKQDETAVARAGTLSSAVPVFGGGGAFGGAAAVNFFPGGIHAAAAAAGVGAPGVSLGGGTPAFAPAAGIHGGGFGGGGVANFFPGGTHVAAAGVGGAPAGVGLGSGMGAAAPMGVGSMPPAGYL